MLPERPKEEDKPLDKAIGCALESVPQVRRLKGIKDNISSGDLMPALGVASLALINFPEDCRDVKSAYNQIKAHINGTEFVPKYNMREYQHNFSFFNGTMLEKWLDKQVDKGNKFANWLVDKDRTLADTSFGDKIIKGVKAEEKDLIDTNIKRYYGGTSSAMSYSGSYFSTITARALRRTTLLGVMVMGLLEVPKLFKSLKKGKNADQKADSLLRQTAKSAVNVASVTAGIGYLGAIGAKHCGPAGSLVGIGLGAIVGSNVSNQIKKVFD